MPFLQGLDRWRKAIEGVVEGVDKAAEKSVREGALVQKLSVRANIEGPPRWRGHQRQARGGGPGVLTGKLRRSVGYTRPVREGYGRWTTYVKARRVYANRTEHRYPYFQPGIRRAEAGLHEIFLRNYTAAVTRGL